MESSKQNDHLGTESRDENDEGDECHSDLCETSEIKEKMKKVAVKTFLPTKLLAKNSLTLPTEVVRSQQSERDVKASDETMPSSGSATGKNVIPIRILPDETFNATNEQ